MDFTARDHRCRLWLILAGLLIAGCDALPQDNAGTLERVRGGILRVGVADHPPWVEFAEERITGIEPALIEQWARELDAQIHWQRGAEAELVEALHRRELDVVAAGFDRKSPYSSKLGLSQAYVEVTNARGQKKKMALAISQGESAFLLHLDRFLARQDRAQLQQQAQRALLQQSLGPNPPP